MIKISPKWIDTARSITGEDHLGIQAYSISFYSKLFPGFTNLTQRVRYYSIYPWFLSNYIKLIGVKNNRKKWRDFLRRCEFLYALVSTIDSNEKSVVGAQRAKNILSETYKKIDFSKYTDMSKDSDDQYWAQSYGGYGQYYLGSLKSLDIIFFEDDSEIEYLGENGKLLVKALDEIIPSSISDKFFKIAKSGNVGIKALEELSIYLKPSNIDNNSEEGKALRKILLEDVNYASDQNRIGSFKLLLTIMNQCEQSEELTYNNLRYILLHKSYTNGDKINIPTDLKCYADNWTAFFVGELTNYSLETLFWASLQRMKNNNNMNINSFSVDMAKYIANVNQKPKIWSKLEVKNFNFPEFLSSIYQRIKINDKDWYKKKFSTYYLIEGIKESIYDDNINDACFFSILLFAKIYNQYHDSQELYDVYNPDTEMGERFSEINPHIVLNNEYLNSNIGVEEGLYGLLNYYIFQRHLKVALAKLRIPPHQSTFKFVLRDSNIEWLEDITPTFTGPRIKTAMNFLEDLNLIDRPKLKLTKLGKTYLK